MLKTAKCPMCVDGRNVNFATGQTTPCETCKGLNYVTPECVCNCGRSCVMEKVGVAYCGEEECFTILKRELAIRATAWVPVTPPGHVVRSTYPGAQRFPQSQFQYDN